MNDLLQTIYDHYKDTYSIISEAVRRRDRLMIFVLIALGFFAFESLFPTTSNTAVNDFLNFKFGLTLKLDLSIIGNFVWFLLLIFTIRYLQVAVFIERQYSYIHKIEDKINKELKEEIITREGKSYLLDYPLFSNWMCMLYVLVFPLLLFWVATVKIISEFKNAYITGWPFGLVLDITAFLILVISIVFYLFIHYKARNKK